MKSFGDMLREAREQKGVTTSDAAAVTRIKAQILEELENNRLQRTHAPIYAKGFIRIYSEYLGLDPETLLEAYEDQRRASPAQDAKPPASRRKPFAPPTKTGPKAAPRSSIQWSRIGKALKNTMDSVIRSLQRIPVAAWRQQIVQHIQAAKSRIAAGMTAKSGAKDLSDRPAADRAPWLQRFHQAVRGPYRLHAALTVICILLLIMIWILISALQRRPPTEGIADGPTAAPADSLADGPPIEFTHEPPPPYYR